MSMYHRPWPYLLSLFFGSTGVLFWIRPFSGEQKIELDFEYPRLALDLVAEDT